MHFVIFHFFGVMRSNMARKVSWTASRGFVTPARHEKPCELPAYSRHVTSHHKAFNHYSGDCA